MHMQKGFSLIGILIVVAVIAAGAAWYTLDSWKLGTEGLEDEEFTACTQEAMQCPDGSYVSRTGPNCEFAPCPTLEVGQDDGTTEQTDIVDTTGWKTYRNEEYGFEFRYPSGLVPIVFAKQGPAELLTILFYDEETALVNPRGIGGIDTKSYLRMRVLSYQTGDPGDPNDILQNYILNYRKEIQSSFSKLVLPNKIRAIELSGGTEYGRKLIVEIKPNVYIVEFGTANERSVYETHDIIDEVKGSFSLTL